MGAIRNTHRMRERRRGLRRRSTPAEQFLWSVLRSRGLKGVRFVRQYSVGPYVVDFLAPSVRLGVELDGAHHEHPDFTEYDRARTEYLAFHGITIIRFRNQDVFDRIDWVLATIAEALIACSTEN